MQAKKLQREEEAKKKAAEADAKARDAAAAAAAREEEEKRKKAAAAKKKKKQVIDDPLRLMLMGGGGPPAKSVDDDPLRMMASSIEKGTADAESKEPGRSEVKAASASARGPDQKSVIAKKTNDFHVDFEPWRVKRERILKKYSTNKRIAVHANFLDDASSSKTRSEESLVIKRLEELKESQRKGRDKLMSQGEYIKHIEQQHAHMKKAWAKGERVVCLRIAIQCAKLLADTSVPRFYPSMFVLLTEILTTFGKLVFQRIKKKSEDVDGQSLPDNFLANDIRQPAKHTCRNWFFKTVCIRELVPRLYIELSLLECNRFLTDDAMLVTLTRIAKSIRGIGGLLCATYAKAYLATKLIAVEPYLIASPGQQLTDPTADTLNDFMFCFKYYNQREFKDVRPVANKKIEIEEYIELLSPALEWLIQIVGRTGTEDNFFTLLQQYKEFCDSSVVLVHILSSFKSTLVSKHAAMLTSLIKQSKDTLVPRPRLFRALGISLCKTAPPKEVRLSILNEIWKTATKIQGIKLYLEVSVVFVEYIAQNFSDRELNIFLKDVIKHMKRNKMVNDGELYGYLEDMVRKIINCSKDLFKVLSMGNFLPIIDFLSKKDKVIISKLILRKFVDRTESTADPVMVHTLFDLARNIHDAIDELSYEDERRQVSELIVSVVRQIDYGRDLERQLNLYVDCRRAFTQLDKVSYELVIRVCLLVVKANRFMKGKHNRKTSAFVKACLAYCHITIPSLDGIFLKLRLYMQCAQVALVNNMVTQGEAFLKSAIQLIPSVPDVIVDQQQGRKRKKKTEDDVLSYVLNICSFLLIFPGHPKSGPFYLVKGLLNSVQKYEPWAKPCAGKTQLYINLLRLFCAFSQKSFPYHVAYVDSNDTLFGNNEIYRKSLAQFTTTLVDQILEQLAGLPTESKDGQAAQSELALDTVNVIVDSMTMNKASATMVVKLIRLAAKSKSIKKYMASTVSHMEAKGGTWFNDIVAKIKAEKGAARHIEPDDRRTGDDAGQHARRRGRVRI